MLIVLIISKSFCCSLKRFSKEAIWTTIRTIISLSSNLDDLVVMAPSCSSGSEFTAERTPLNSLDCSYSLSSVRCINASIQLHERRNKVDFGGLGHFSFEPAITHSFTIAALLRSCMLTSLTSSAMYSNTLLFICRFDAFTPGIYRR